MAGGRKPDYKLKVLNKANERRGEVGGGWLNEDGSITVKLNPCIVLQDDPDLVYTLFPATYKGPSKFIEEDNKG
jgi:hypothetical protein